MILGNPSRLIVDKVTSEKPVPYNSGFQYLYYAPNAMWSYLCQATSLLVPLLVGPTERPARPRPKVTL